MTEEWMDGAFCRTLTREQVDRWLFPAPGTPAIGKLICRNCPVRQECLDHAMEHRERIGVWGGTSGSERSQMIGTYKVKRTCTHCLRRYETVAAAQGSTCSPECSRAHSIERSHRNRLEAEYALCVVCGAAARPSPVPPTCSPYCSRVVDRRMNFLGETG